MILAAGIDGSEVEKLRIAEESYPAPWQASATARRHGISNQLLFARRKAYREGRLGEGCGSMREYVAAKRQMVVVWFWLM